MNQEQLSVKYYSKRLPNGTVVIVVPKTDTRLASVNLLYRIGSKNESPEMTGMAHLMEHLMFSGTEKYPAYDLPITRVGGVNNAFTNQDMTNFYIMLPASHIELAFNLEADRMTNLLLNTESVEVQKNVVVEEFRQRYLNQPYGDLNHLLSDAAFKEHPYRWPTIGLKPEHVEAVKVQDVADFYSRYYHPANMILTVAGNVDPDKVFDLANNYFGTLKPASGDFTDNITPQESVQNRRCRKVVHRDVPASLLAIAFPVTSNTNDDFTGFGFLADILGQGIISRLHTALVKDSKIFTRISAGLTATADPGLFTISGLLHDNIDSDYAAEQVQRIIDSFISSGATSAEMKSVMNGMMTATLYKRQHVMNLALEFAMAEFQENAEKANRIFADYERVDNYLLIQLAAKFLTAENRIELHYLKNES